MYIYNYQSFTFTKPLQWSEIKAASLIDRDTAISEEDYVHEILHQFLSFTGLAVTVFSNHKQVFNINGKHSPTHFV